MIVGFFAAAAFGAMGACEGNDHTRTEVSSGDCYVCHQADYEGAMNPTHVGEYPITCGDCHTNDAWRPAAGGSHPEDRFPVATNHHSVVDCAGCHDADRGPNLEGRNTDCVGCHSGEHTRAQMDERHASVSGYPTGDAPPSFCLTCHPTGEAAVAGHPEERFPTTGDHAVACTDCHNQELGLSEGGANTDCVGCHTGEHERALMDVRHRGVHVPLYPTGPAAPNYCLSCHPTGQAPIALHPEAAFPIDTGPHEPYECGSCHDPARGSNVGGANAICVGCHDGSHDRATMDPTHAGVAGYPAGPAEPNFCLTCHPSGSAASAAHPEDRFAITTGNHAALTCDSCHDSTLGSSIGGANTDCVGCHTGEHARATVDPIHGGVSGYPSGPAAPNFCLTCHPGGTADDVAHPEAAFPITSGPHSPFDCGHCHNPALGSNAGGMNADCIGCHTGEHTRTRMDSKHREVSDYPIGDPNPHFCLSCHPDGTD